jgi:hypothetical protein
MLVASQQWYGEGGEAIASFSPLALPTFPSIRTVMQARRYFAFSIIFVLYETIFLPWSFINDLLTYKIFALKVEVAVMVVVENHKKSENVALRKNKTADSSRFIKFEHTYRLHTSIT